MGTNYYYEIHNDNGEIEEELHIGKSSMGWVFMVHVIPEKNLNFLHEWILFILSTNGNIKDEYGNIIDLHKLLCVATERRKERSLEEIFKPDGYCCSIKEFYRKNHAEPGPNNLIRSKINNKYCAGHGEGTWDYHIGNFS